MLNNVLNDMAKSLLWSVPEMFLDNFLLKITVTSCVILHAIQLNLELTSTDFCYQYLIVLIPYMLDLGEKNKLPFL